MADNFQFTPGTGATGAADDIGGVLHQRVKVTWGPDGTANDADVASGKPLPVQLRVSDGTALAFGTGVRSSGTLRVTVATDDAVPVTIASVPSHAVTNAGTFAVQAAGDVAHDAADSGSPQKIGGRARTSEIAAVANNDRVDFIADKVGKQIVSPYTNPENLVNGVTAAMTGTTSTSLLAAPGAGLFNYITSVWVSNSHATVGTDIELQDGSGGTTFAVLPAAAVYGGAAPALTAPLKQPTANTALYVKNSVTGASVRVTAIGFKGA